MRSKVSSLQATIAFIEEEFSDCPDLIRRKVYLKRGYEAYFLYFKGLVNTSIVQHDFISPILLMEVQELKEENFFNLPVQKVKFYKDNDGIVTAILAGEVVLISECLEYAISAKFEFTKYNEDNQQDKIFQEHLIINLALLRRKIKSQHFKYKILEGGGEIGEKVAIAYFQGVADETLLNQTCRRIQTAISEEGYEPNQIGLALEDFPHSPFPQYQCTQSTDLAIDALREGRLVILRGQTEVGILAPANFFTFFHAPEDSHTHWLLASAMRLFRIFMIMIIVFLPGIYIALTSFHYHFLNMNALILLAQSRVSVPFLPVIEVIIMESILTVFFELASRISNHTGVLIGISGALFIGGALLISGVISNILLIISALSLLASFLIPIYHMQTIRLLRCLFILLSSLFGMLGVAISASLTFAHLIVLETLGQPYLRPFIPFKFKEALTSIIKVPNWFLRKTIRKEGE